MEEGNGKKKKKLWKKKKDTKGTQKKNKLIAIDYDPNTYFAINTIFVIYFLLWS
jgi:hypothetical protein